MKTFHLPDLGEGLKEAEIVTWHVAEGERVVTDQPLVSVETDKAVVEVPSPRSGIIGSLNAKEGDLIRVGAVLVEYAEEDMPDSGTVVGSIKSEESPEKESAANEQAAPGPEQDFLQEGSVRATPGVRALARRLGIDINDVTPTGRKGNVTASDVKSAGDRLAAGTQGERLRGTRRSMAERMSDAHSRVVPAFAADEADVGGWPDGADITGRVIRAIVVGCQAEPAVNAWFDDRALTVLRHDQVNLGIAVDSEHGLFVPVIRDAGGKDIKELREQLQILVGQVEGRSLSPETLKGATLTYSNFGALGVRLAQMVVVPPQVAIVGTGQIREAAIAVNGQIKASRVLPVSVAFDHRVVTGGEGARFLRALIGDLEQKK